MQENDDDVQRSLCRSRSTIGVVATAVNGGSTLRAAVASRMRNQRQRCGRCFGDCSILYGRKMTVLLLLLRLMEQQLGGRGPPDPRRSGDAPMSGNGLASYRKEDKERSVGSGNESAYRQEEMDGLQDKVAHQKMEIARLLNTVKTLSSENSKLVNVRRVSLYDCSHARLRLTVFALCRVEMRSVDEYTSGEP